MIIPQTLVMQVRCEAQIMVPYGYRRERGRSVAMSYAARRCKRHSTDHFRGHDYCWQHYRQEVGNRQDWDVPL